jgi:hypothetical protein
MALAHMSRVAQRAVHVGSLSADAEIIGPRAVDLGDDVRRIRWSRLCRSSPPPDGSGRRVKATAAIVGIFNPGRDWLPLRIFVANLSQPRPVLSQPDPRKLDALLGSLAGLAQRFQTL